MKIYLPYFFPCCLLVVTSCIESPQASDPTPAHEKTIASDHPGSSSGTNSNVGTNSIFQEEVPFARVGDFDPTRIDTNFEGLTEQIQRWGIVDELNRGLSFAPKVRGIKNVSDHDIAQALGVELTYRGKSKRVQGMGLYARVREEDGLRLHISSRRQSARGAPSGLPVVTIAQVENTGAAKWTDEFLARIGIASGCDGTSVQRDTMGMGGGSNEIWFMDANAERRCMIAGREVFNMSASVSIGKQGDLTDIEIKWPEIRGYSARKDGAKWTEAGLREVIAAEVFRLRDHTPPVDYVGLGYTVHEDLLVPTISVGGTSGNIKHWGDLIELGNVTPR